MKTIMNTDDFNERKRRIQEKRKKLLTQLNFILGKERSKENKKSTRKAMLLGQLLLGEAANNEKTKSWVTQFLDKRLTSAGERALFDLPVATSKTSETTSGHNLDGASH